MKCRARRVLSTQLNWFKYLANRRFIIVIGPSRYCVERIYLQLFCMVGYEELCSGLVGDFA